MLISAKRLLKMRAVGLVDAPALLGKYSHELSGGMQQRVVMALALLGKPAALVADEPTTALDVTTQSQVLALIATLARQSGTAVSPALLPTTWPWCAVWRTGSW